MGILRMEELMENSKKFYITYFLCYFVCALGATQLIPYLVSHDFSNMQKGWILAFIAFMTLISQFTFGFLSDKFSRLKIFFSCSFIICIIANVIIFMFDINNFVVASILVSVTGGLARCWQGIIDTWILQMNDGQKNYPKYRSLGAIGWALGSWGAAIILSISSFRFLSIIMLSVFVYSSRVLSCCPDVERLKQDVSIKDVKEIIQNKQFIFIVAILFVLFSMGCADIYLVVDKILELGGTSFHVGLKWGLQSLAEAPIFFLAPKVCKRISNEKILTFSIVMFGIRFVLYGIISNVWLLVLAALMQMVTFPLAMVASKNMIDDLIDTKMKSSAQLFAMSFYMGGALFVMPILTSWISDLTSINFTLYLVSLMSIIAIFILNCFNRNKKNHSL